jgi:predicted restriction endonuclease
VQYAEVLGVPLRDTILLPDQAQLSARKYLDWHKANIFVP